MCKQIFLNTFLFLLLFVFGCVSVPQNDNSPRNWKYFNIYASAEDDIIFVQLQDDLGFSPKMERYILTVNLTNKNDLYIIIGGEQNSTAKKYSWTMLRKSVRDGLVNWTGSNKENLAR